MKNIKSSTVAIISGILILFLLVLLIYQALSHKSEIDNLKKQTAAKLNEMEQKTIALREKLTSTVVNSYGSIFAILFKDLIVRGDVRSIRDKVGELIQSIDLLQAIYIANKQLQIMATTNQKYIGKSLKNIREFAEPINKLIKTSKPLLLSKDDTKRVFYPVVLSDGSLVGIIVLDIRL